MSLRHVFLVFEVFWWPIFYPQVMQLSGIDGEQVVLLLEDHQVDPSFLELINSLLSAGEVPGLYTPEEIEPLLGPLRDLASQDGFRGTLVSYFASRVRRNLHMVMIMDSSSKHFTANCESNPAFYKNCSFQWMQGWTKESMAQSKCMSIQNLLTVLYIYYGAQWENLHIHWRCMRRSNL